MSACVAVPSLIAQCTSPVTGTSVVSVTCTPDTPQLPSTTDASAIDTVPCGSSSVSVTSKSEAFTGTSPGCGVK
jgi:hypothetical protein